MNHPQDFFSVLTFCRCPRRYQTRQTSCNKERCGCAKTGTSCWSSFHLFNEKERKEKKRKTKLSDHFPCGWTNPGPQPEPSLFNQNFPRRLKKVKETINDFSFFRTTFSHERAPTHVMRACIKDIFITAKTRLNVECYTLYTGSGHRL